MIRWGIANAVTYDIAKMEAVLFSRSHCQRLNTQISDINIRIRNQTIKFNKEATQWLEIWLDNQLKFTIHINKKCRAARAVKIKIKRLTQMQSLAPGLIGRIHLAMMQSTALYGIEFW